MDEEPDGYSFRGQSAVGEDRDDAAVESAGADGSADEPAGTSGSRDAANGEDSGITVQPAVEVTGDAVGAQGEVDVPETGDAVGADGEGEGVTVQPAVDVTGDSVGTDGEGHVPENGDGDKARRRAASSRGRRVTFGVLRAMAVLAVAAVAYAFVVPTGHVVRTRLSRLVLTKSSVAAFDKAKPQAGQQDDTQTGIAALTTAAKRSPNQTGLYSIEWSPSDNSGAGIIAFLLPSESDARTALSQIRAQQLGADSYSSNSLSRASTYAVPGVPGSYAAVYRPSAKDAGSPSLAVTVFRYGRVVAVSEAASPGSTAQSAANTMTTGEYGNLRRVGTGFSLSVTRYPVVATSLWIVGAVVLAAIAAMAPVARRRRALRRLRADEQEMAHRVVIGKQVIVKHRR
jgi:hypothetical protein